MRTCPLPERRSHLVVLVFCVAALELAAGVGLGYVAGFNRVQAVFGHFDGRWLLVAVGGLAVSSVGYYFAYRAVYRMEDGPRLPFRQMVAVVAAGFGGFLGHGGSILDKYMLERAGTSASEARERVTVLSGMEQGVLAIGACGASIAVLALGFRTPPLDATLPWALAPLPGFLLGFWLAGRYESRFYGRSGWRGRLGGILRAVRLIHHSFLHPFRLDSPVMGMSLFWAADVLAAWAGMAAFGLHLNVAQTLVGFGSGMVFNRRTGLLGGAGILSLALPVAMWYSGAPLATAVVGMFAYRTLSLWLPMPLALASLRTLRAIGQDPSRPDRIPTPKPSGASLLPTSG